MAKAGRRARCRARRLRGAARREPPRDFAKRLAEHSTIEPEDESFDTCSFPDADVRLLAQEALAEVYKGELVKAMEILGHRPCAVQALRLMIDGRSNIVSLEDEEGHNPGLTLLHSAAADGQISLVAVLLDAGADPDARDANGWTPLAYACGNDEHGASVVSCLLEHGADPHAVSHDNSTALHAAAASNNVDICKLLIAAGIDVNARATDVGHSALHLAFRNAAPTCVATLLDAGAHIDGRSSGDSMFWGSPRALQILFRAERRCVLEAFSYMESLGDDDYTDDCQDALRLNVAYIKRILKAGGRKAGAYETYERDQRNALANIVRRHVVGHRVPAEIGDIIVEFWGHPGGYVVF